MKLQDLSVGNFEKGRDTWTFMYSKAALIKATSKVHEYHSSRAKVYTEQADALEVKLRESGVQLREQAVTGGANFQAVVDPALGSQLSEARARRDSHRLKRDLFKTYAAAFEVSVETFYKLTISDVDFFCLHREPGE